MENNYSNVQLNFNQESGDISFRSEKEGSIYFLGLLAICCATLTSGFAGVYNEKLIKNGQQPSLLIRSIQLSKYPFFLLITQMSIFSFSFFRFVFCFLRLFRRSSKRRWSRQHTRVFLWVQSICVVNSNYAGNQSIKDPKLHSLLQKPNWNLLLFFLILLNFQRRSEE